LIPRTKDACVAADAVAGVATVYDASKPAPAALFGVARLIVASPLVRVTFRPASEMPISPDVEVPKNPVPTVWVR